MMCMRIEERGDSLGQAPELPVPVEGPVDPSTVLVRIFNRSVKSSHRIWSRFSLTNPQHGPGAQGVDNEKGEQRPKDPEGVALVGRSFRDLRLGGRGFGRCLSRLADHEGNLSRPGAG